MGRSSRIMSTTLIAIALTALAAQIAAAQPALPSTFKSQIVHSPAGADIFVRSAGTGPAVVLIHGYAETSDSWAPLAPPRRRTGKNLPRDRARPPRHRQLLPPR